MRPTVILCAHGTSDPRGRAVLGSLAAAVRKELPSMVVAEATVEGPEPTLAQIVRATSGSRVIMPLMVFASQADRSTILEVAGTDPQVTVTAPLGPDWVLAEVAVRRLLEAGARPGDVIVLAADGVDGTAAVAEISQAARLVSAVWGGAVHVGALGAGADAPLSDVIADARAQGGRVVVLPYLLAPSPALRQINDAGGDVVAAPILDAHAPDPRLVALIAARTATRSHWMAPVPAE